jgi:hypothetical protein
MQLIHEQPGHVAHAATGQIAKRKDRDAAQIAGVIAFPLDQFAQHLARISDQHARGKLRLRIPRVMSRDSA